MGNTWDKKRTAKETSTQWSVLLTILFLLVLPCAGFAALGYFYVNGYTTGLLLTVGGFCLLALALPLLALFYLTRQARRDRRRRGPYES